MVRAAILTLLAAVVPTAGPVFAQGEQMQTIWSCKDRDGRIMMTNEKADTLGKECRVISQQRVSVAPVPVPAKPPAGEAAAPAKPAPRAAPAGFPRETPGERVSARERQKKTIETELVQEEQLLERARKDLVAEQEAVRSPAGTVPRALERLQKFRDAVEVHERNVQSLRRELATLR